MKEIEILLINLVNKHPVNLQIIPKECYYNLVVSEKENGLYLLSSNFNMIYEIENIFHIKIERNKNGFFNFFFNFKKNYFKIENLKGFLEKIEENKIKPDVTNFNVFLFGREFKRGYDIIKKMHII